MRIPSLSLLVLSPLVVACTTTAPAADEAPLRRAPQGTCEAGSSQSHLGAKATSELGTALLAETGAKTLRWVPPRTAVTMDFRPDRLTVSYDDDMIVTRISCG